MSSYPHSKLTSDESTPTKGLGILQHFYKISLICNAFLMPVCLSLDTLINAWMPQYPNTLSPDISMSNTLMSESGPVQREILLLFTLESALQKLQQIGNMLDQKAKQMSQPQLGGDWLLLLLEQGGNGWGEGNGGAGCSANL